MLACIFLLALFSPAQIAAENFSVAVTVSPDLADAMSAGLIQAQVISTFTARYGKLVEAWPEAQGRVSLSRDGSSIAVITEVGRKGLTRSFSSTIAASDAQSLAPTIAGDLAYLRSSLDSFSDVPLGSPPRLSAVLQTDTLTALTGWQENELEPVAVAAAEDGFLLCFPHRWLSLGPSFRLEQATARDLLAESAGPEKLLISGMRLQEPAAGSISFRSAHRRLRASTRASPPHPDPRPIPRRPRRIPAFPAAASACWSILTPAH